MELIQKVKTLLLNYSTPRYRDRRGFHASSAMDCLRDQYWAAKGEPITNPTDVVGKLRMLAGTAVEEELMKQVFQNLHLYGVHLLATQVSVGGSNPNWDGYVDALVATKDETGSITKYAVEVKTASGYGADMLYNGEPPKDSYLAQIGLYLRDLHSKGVTRYGKLFYVLLSDNHFGSIVVVDVEYLPEQETVRAYRVSYSDKPANEVSITFDIRKQVLSRWERLEYCLATDTVPEPEYGYKKPLTPEFLASVSTTDLKKAYRGEKILGDWQVRYSRYFDKILQLSGESREYTEAERALIKQEHDGRLTEKGNKVRPLKDNDRDVA